MKTLMILAALACASIPIARAAHAGGCTTTCNRFGNTTQCNTYCY
jgi:hypothetical protein